jgi:hypothetical protein
MGCMEMSSHVGVSGFEHCGYKLKSPMSFQQASDKDAACRAVLRSHAEPPDHVLGDITDRLTPAGWKKVRAAEKLNNIDKDNSFGEKMLTKLSKDQLTEGRETIVQVGLRCLERLMKVLEPPGVLRREVWCYTHDAYCNVSASRLPNDFCVFFDVTGSVCVPWSIMGTMLGFCEPVSCLLFAICLTDLIVAQPTFVLHECTTRFMWPVFPKYMSNYAWESVIGDAVDFGLAGTRRRRLTLGTNKSACHMVRPLSGVSMLHRNVLMSSDAYCTCEPDLDVQEYKQQLATKDMLPSTCSWEELVGVSKYRRIIQYRTLPKVAKLQSAGRAVVFNVDQNPLECPMASHLIPCQLRHCNLRSEGARRLLTPKGHLGVSMVPMWPDLVEGTGLSWPFFSYMPSSAQMTSMSGNAQNLTFIGSHIQFIFCNLRLSAIENHFNRQGLNRMPAVTASPATVVDVSDCPGDQEELGS